jgi:hypothetical protein
VSRDTSPKPDCYARATERIEFRTEHWAKDVLELPATAKSPRKPATIICFDICMTTLQNPMPPDLLLVIPAQSRTPYV